MEAYFTNGMPLGCVLNINAQNSAIAEAMILKTTPLGTIMISVIKIIAPSRDTAWLSGRNPKYGSDESWGRENCNGYC